jgi:hypothetical protein
MSQIISVTPVGDGWAVTTDAFDSDMMFLSGAKAEAAARRLARTLAQNGQNAEIRIFLRGGALAGRFAVPAAPMAMAAP